MNLISWEEVVPLLHCFCVWEDTPEMQWFQKAWKSLAADGLTEYANDQERHWVLARGIALGLMYGDYCQLEWGQYSDSESCIGELYCDDGISHVRVGAIAGDAIGSDECDHQTLFVWALDYMAGRVRREVYTSLVRGFGSCEMLYVTLRFSRRSSAQLIEVGSSTADFFDEYGDPINGTHAAWLYVLLDSMAGTDL